MIAVAPGEGTPLLKDHGSSAHVGDKWMSHQLKNNNAGLKDQPPQDYRKQRTSSIPEGASLGYTREQKLTCVTVTLLNTALQISFAVIAPFFPEEAARKGATPTEVGLIFGLFQFVIFVTSPIYGSLINVIGVRFMFLAGSFLCGGCNIIFGFLDDLPDGTIYVVMCFICRGIEANGASMMTTASFSIMAKQFKNNVGSALGVLKTFAGIGMVLGPSIGGGLYAVGGYKAPFILVGSLVLIATLIAYFVLPNIDEGTTFEGNPLGLLKIPGCVVVYLITIGNSMAMSFLDPTFSPFMEQNFHLSVGKIGLLFIVSPAVYALVSPLTGWLSDKGWLGTLLIIGLFGNSLAFYLLGPAPFLSDIIPLTLVETILALCLLGLTLSFCLIPVFPLVINLTRLYGYDDSLQTLGIISGYFNSGGALGAFVGPSAAGYFSDRFGFAWSSAIFAFIVTGLGLMMVVYITCSKIFSIWPIPYPQQEDNPLTPTEASASSSTEDAYNQL